MMNYFMLVSLLFFANPLLATTESSESIFGLFNNTHIEDNQGSDLSNLEGLSIDQAIYLNSALITMAILDRGWDKLPHSFRNQFLKAQKNSLDAFMMITSEQERLKLIQEIKNHAFSYKLGRSGTPVLTKKAA